jgi:hypothetical protein
VRTVVDNILRFSPQNTSDLVVIVAAIIWLALWGICMADAKTSHRGTLGKIFWMLILSIPLAGLLLYAATELMFADWRAALSWRKNDAVKKPGASFLAQQ